ncbi:MAG: transglutaminase domain-containing protein [Spirochaetia bacterium]
MKHRQYFFAAAVLIAAALLSCQTVEKEYEEPRPLGVPDEITRVVKEDPRENLQRLINYIKENSQSESEAFRYAHDWVAVNVAYDMAVFNGEAERVDDPYEVISYGKTVCEGYSRLLKLLCEKLGIECEYVLGYVREFEYDSSEEAEMDGPRPAHAWNAVKLEGRWKLVDVTYNSDIASDEKNYIPRYSQTYYLIPPEQFIHTHFPMEEKWQLLEEPLSFEEFKSLPYLSPSFFHYGLEQVERYEKVAPADEGTRTIRIAVPSEADINVYLHHLQKSREILIQGFDLITADATGLHTIDIRFPGAGKYSFSLVVKDSRSEGPYHFAAIYFFEVEEASPDVRPFPKVYRRFVEHRIRDLSPDYRDLEGGKKVEFSFATDVRGKYALIVSDEGTHQGTYEFSKNAAGRYEAEISARGDTVYFAVREDGQYRTLATYAVK